MDRFAAPFGQVKPVADPGLLRADLEGAKPVDSDGAAVSALDHPRREPFKDGVDHIACEALANAPVELLRHVTD